MIGPTDGNVAHLSKTSQPHVVVYVQKVEYEDLSDAWAQTYSAGAWSEAVRLGIDERTGAAFQPSVAMDSRGNAIVVWREDADMWAASFK